MLAGWMNRHQLMVIEYLMEENKVLKELHGDKRLNFTDAQRKRLARKGRKLGLNGLRKVVTLVTPETILAWHRKLVAMKYTAKRQMSVLRKSQQEVRRMVVRIALENPTWGYSRIVGALQNLGVKRTKTMIANILQKEGIKPTPERHHLDWNGFLKSHWEVLCATDFFTTEVWTLKGLVRYRPGEPLMNIYAERFVKSIKNECLDRLIFVGEASLQTLLRPVGLRDILIFSFPTRATGLGGIAIRAAECGGEMVGVGKAAAGGDFPAGKGGGAVEQAGGFLEARLTDIGGGSDSERALEEAEQAAFREACAPGEGRDVEVSLEVCLNPAEGCIEAGSMLVRI
jgi:hypothetical protein